MEVVGKWGAYLGLEQDSALFAYFRRHYAHFFPALRTVHRSTSCGKRPACGDSKNGCGSRRWRVSPHDPTVAIIDSFPLPVCQFARAYRCRRFRGDAAFGKDTLVRQTFYGFCVHVRLEWPGVITRFCAAPANVHELMALPALTEQTVGTLVGDRNNWSPTMTATARRTASNCWRPTARPSAIRIRAGVPCSVACAIASARSSASSLTAATSSGSGRDPWHLCSWLLRQVLMHTVAVLLDVDLGNPPPHLARLVA